MKLEKKIEELRSIAERRDFKNEYSNCEFTKGYERGLKWGETQLAIKALEIIQYLQKKE